MIIEFTTTITMIMMAMMSMTTMVILIMIIVMMFMSQECREELETVCSTRSVEQSPGVKRPDTRWVLSSS